MTQNVKKREARAGEWGYVLTAILLAVMLVAFYVLSVGPAAWLLCHSESGTVFWNKVYWPVIHTLGDSPLNTAFLLYVNWWANLSRPA